MSDGPCLKTTIGDAISCLIGSKADYQETLWKLKELYARLCGNDGESDQYTYKCNTPLPRSEWICLKCKRRSTEGDGCPYCPPEPPSPAHTLREAADDVDALQARVKELEAANREMAKALSRVQAEKRKVEGLAEARGEMLNRCNYLIGRVHYHASAATDGPYAFRDRKEYYRALERINEICRGVC